MYEYKKTYKYYLFANGSDCVTGYIHELPIIFLFTHYINDIDNYYYIAINNISGDSDALVCKNGYNSSSDNDTYNDRSYYHSLLFVLYIDMNRTNYYKKNFEDVFKNFNVYL